LPASRYRHPGDVIRLIAGGLILIVTLAAAALAPSQLVGTDASAVTWLGADPAGRVLVGLVQVAFVVAAAGIVAIALQRRRFRLLISLAAGAMVAGGALAGIVNLIGAGHPHAVAVNLGHGSWLASAAFPGPALLAGAVAVTVAASPWLSGPRPRLSRRLSTRPSSER
jgi:MFS family permease